MSTTTTTIPGYVAGTWNVDSTHSEITFAVRHLAISKVRGSFTSFTATLVTGENILESTVTATIDISSVSTGNADRDGHLQSNEFFLASEYPQMTFVSKSITAKGNDLTIDGELTLRGVTKPVALDAEIGGITTDGYGQTKAGFSAKTKIDRTEFGVTWNAALEAGGFTLGNEVTIDLDLQFILSE